jgi:hypothetical protein
MEGTVVSEDESSPGGPLSESTGGLKDTFWKDLEEGRVNLFDTDMYSRVKGGGRGPRSEKKNKSSDGSSVRRVNSSSKKTRSGSKENSLKESNRKKHHKAKKCLVKQEDDIKEDNDAFDSISSDENVKINGQSQETCHVSYKVS